ncbi:PH domain-containing protein [Brooklawnia sp.]|uniref:PH domain-containing protein n=1 Tax=Brooklawnia sp. TaxID=2699740 RepID=UPI00312018C1
MSEPGTPIEPQPAHQAVLEHPHPLTPIAKSWIAIVAVGYFIVRDAPDLLRDAPSGGWGTIGHYWYVPAGLLAAVLAISLIAGYVTWRFTSFIIDDEQVRIERNFISQRSERIAFTKIQSVDVTQPLIARLLGLAALRIDVGGGGSNASIEYLSRKRAYQLRDYLITRAHGTRTTVATAAGVPVGTAFSDISAADRAIVAVPPGRLLASMIVTNSTVVILVLVTGVVGFSIWTDTPLALASTSLLLPWLLGMGAYLLNRLRNEWNFTLTMTPDGGLRTASGLTSLTSQTIPRNRVQAVDISQPLLWRAMGWYRVRIDVLGVPSESGEHVPANLLLPVGPGNDVSIVLGALWPRLAMNAIEMHPIPRRARWLRWLDAQTYSWGFDERVLIAAGGLLRKRTSIVPHARVQSVRISQGIIARRLRLADLQAHTTPGPVDVVCRHLDEADARMLAMSELDRMRAARSRLDLSLLHVAASPSASWDLTKG